MSNSLQTEPLPVHLPARERQREARDAPVVEHRPWDNGEPVALGRRQGRSRPRTIRQWILPMFVFGFLAPPLLGLALIGAIYWQARTDEARPVDAIVVLGAAQYNGRPTSVLRARLDEVVKLYNQDLAPVVVVTGGNQEGDVTTEAEASRDYLVEHGVPASKILMENEGRDTWQSMQGVATILKQRDLSRVLLVSDGFHLLRSKVMARDLGLTPFVTAATESPIRQNTTRELGFVVREAVAIVAYKAGRLGWGT